MTERIELYPGIRLTVFTDSRFKQNCLSIQYVRKMDRSEAAMNALIPSVLLRGTNSAMDLRQITLRLDELYGASVSPISRRTGDYQTTGFYVSMMDDRFALDGESVLEQTLSFVKDLLFDYPTENGGFLPDFVEGEKVNQIAAIQAELNDKRVYAVRQLLKNMCREDSFGIPRMGEVSDVAAITPQELLDHYLRIRRESPVQLYYVGSARPQKVARCLREMFAQERRDYRPLPDHTPLKLSGKQDIRERMEVAQGKLCMGFSTPVTNRDRDFAAMQVMNGVFGGDVTSKLFQNVREKQSLCYYCGARTDLLKDAMFVESGVDMGNIQAVQAAVLEQLRAVQNGDFTEDEAQKARLALANGCRTVKDYLGSTENWYLSQLFSSCVRSPEEDARRLLQVGREGIIRAAQDVTLDTVYVLKGKGKA